MQPSFEHSQENIKPLRIAYIPKHGMWNLAQFRISLIYDGKIEKDISKQKSISTETYTWLVRDLGSFKSGYV